ncbi:MAG: cbb3-type cytochrome c oxidase subunit I [Betaproteobacteria bacterium]|nr:cbb3-type cytochrome c oxidase subunit I [Betaproteobacteria bacterium]
MKAPALTEGLRQLPAGDKRLLKVCFGAALIALTLGVLFGAGTAGTRAGFVDSGPLYGYRMMTAHGVSIFFYWLYFAQAGLLLAFGAVFTVPGGHIAWRPLAWTGLATMIAGFVASGYAVIAGLPLLYDAPPELAGVPSPAVAAFYLGYLLLAAGLFCVAVSGVATVLKPRFDHRIASWPVVSFAAVGWAGLLIVSSIAALNAFLPAARWALGLSPMPSDYSVGWHVLFHNMHYLPLMATVIVWYVLVQAVAGVKSVFGAHLSKIAFAIYLIFVPPTSLYHMFLEPNLAEAVRVIGSLLSLFISVPTVTVFLVIVASLEVHARTHGAKGLFGWIGMLPWRNPAMAAMGMAVVNLAIGGAFSFVLIQEKIAPLLSDTFFVPGYFHFLTVGTVTLTFLAALCYVLPGVTGHALWKPGLLTALPYFITAGLLIFGASGVTAGYLGVPRRVLDVAYDGTAPALWGTLMAGIGIGGVIMAAGLLTYLYGLFRTLWPAPAEDVAGMTLPSVAWGDVTPAATRAWAGPLSVLLLVGAMAFFTALAFEMIQALPLQAAGAMGGH